MLGAPHLLVFREMWDTSNPVSPSAQTAMRLGFGIPHLAKNSEIWGTADSGSKCNKISITLIPNKRNPVSEMGCDALKWSMEKLESKGRFPLCHRPGCCCCLHLLRSYVPTICCIWSLYPPTRHSCAAGIACLNSPTSSRPGGPSAERQPAREGWVENHAVGAP